MMSVDIISNAHLIASLLTQQPSTHCLQHGEDGEKVESSIDAFEAVRLPQATGDLLHQEWPQHHHQHQAEGIVDQHYCVSAVHGKQVSLDMGDRYRINHNILLTYFQKGKSKKLGIFQPGPISDSLLVRSPLGIFQPGPISDSYFI